MKRKNLLMPILVIIISALFVQCSNDDDEMHPNETDKGMVKLSLTDAPSDDPNIQGTFVTVSEVKIDGETIEGFSKQTIELSAYQKGETKLLFNDDLEAKSYNSVSLVLDNESDAYGNSPGCYVLDDNSKKHKLGPSGESTSEIILNSSFDVEKDSTTTLVVDFDLRKSVVRETDSETETEYTFVTNTELKNSVRLVNVNSCGTVLGKVEVPATFSGEMYVFAYHKGQFNSTTESQGEGASEVKFANAVTSCKVEADGSYRLSFLEEGDYEVHIASYSKNTNNHLMFQSMLSAQSSISGLLLENLNVSAKSQVQLNISIVNLI